MMKICHHQNHPRFLSVCLNPTLQKTLILESVTEGQVNRCSGNLTDASGKGINVTRVLTQLGADVTHLTHGGGHSLEEFKYRITKDDLKVRIIPAEQEIRYCYTVINRRTGTVTEFVEQGKEIIRKTESDIIAEYLNLLENTDFVILSGSKAPGYSSRIFPHMVREAKKQDKFVILDYRGDDLVNSLEFGPDIINPNLTEFILTFFNGVSAGEESEDPEAIAAVESRMSAIYSEFGTVSVLTNGKKEVLYTDEGKIKRLSPPLTVPVNTIGSGDSFTAGLAWKLASGKSLETAVDFANICGAKNASLIKPGSIIP